MNSERGGVVVCCSCYLGVRDDELIIVGWPK